jgi:hypothetical protein
MKKCEGLQGVQLDECKRKMNEILEDALDECTPKTACEEKADAEYDSKKNECLANGGTAAACEEEA